MTGEKIADLESRIAWAESEVQELNKVVYKQECRIAELEKLVEEMRKRIGDLMQQASNVNPDHEVPPHY